MCCYVGAMLESLYGRENYVAAKKLLDVAELRHRALTSNVANAETPGYKRVDIDAVFEASLERAMQTGNIEKIQRAQPLLKVDDIAHPVRPDGNNVSVDQELLEMNKNALEYEFLTNYVSSSIKRLRTTITGRNGQ